MSLTIWIAGTCPPHLNSNYELLAAITEGFEIFLARDCTSGNARLVPFLELHEALSEGSPDLLLLVGGVALPLVDLAGIATHCRQKGIPLFFWSLEDPYEIDCLEAQIHWFDMICTSDYGSSLVLPSSPPVRHLPLAARPRHKPAELSGEWSLGHWLFCGIPFPVREQWINSISKAPLNGLVIGPGWQSLGNTVRVHHQRIEPTVLHALYQNWPVTLTIGRDLNIHNIRRLKASTPGPRLFECAASGGRQLVCGDGLEASIYYSPDKEILVAETPEEAVEKIRLLERDKRLAASLSENAWRRTQADHLYSHRAARMLEYAQDLSLL